MRHGIQTPDYRDHFQHRRDLAEVLYDTGQIALEDALNLYFAAALELTVAQERALFAPRRATKRLKQRRWVVENVIPRLWDSTEFVEPQNFCGWRTILEELVDSYVEVRSDLPLKDRVLGPGASAARRVIMEWEKRRQKRRAALRGQQPRRIVGLLPAPSPPLLQSIANSDEPIPVEPIK